MRSGNAFLDVSDPDAIEVHIRLHPDELNPREPEAIEDLGQELNEAMICDHQELNKTMTSDQELDRVMVSGQC